MSDQQVADGNSFESSSLEQADFGRPLFGDGDLTSGERLSESERQLLETSIAAYSELKDKLDLLRDRPEAAGVIEWINEMAADRENYPLFALLTENRPA